jgi:hypothetical protein
MLMATFAYTIWLMVLPLLVVLLAGCGESFPTFNEVDRFRVLAVKADPPALAVGEVAEISALLHVPEGQEVTYKWSWCPFATSPKDGSKCLISEEDLTELLAGFLGNPENIIDDEGNLIDSAGELIDSAGDVVADAGDLVDDVGELADTSLDLPDGAEDLADSAGELADSAEEALASAEDIADTPASFLDEETLEQAEQFLANATISYDLGTGPTASFINVVPPELLEQLCNNLITDELPAFVGMPTCGDKLDVVIRLEVTSEDTTLYATKKLPLYVDAERATNTNPAVTAVHLFKGESKREVAATSALPVLLRKETYRMVADVALETADTFVPLPTADIPNPEARKESLFITWYVVGGDTDFGRTTFFDGEIPMSTLRENAWDIPSIMDYPEDDAWLYLVLQDERGGIGWLSRRFTLKD